MLATSTFFAQLSSCLLCTGGPCASPAGALLAVQVLRLSCASNCVNSGSIANSSKLMLQCKLASRHLDNGCLPPHQAAPGTGSAAEGAQQQVPFCCTASPEEGSGQLSSGSEIFPSNTAAAAVYRQQAHLCGGNLGIMCTAAGCYQLCVVRPCALPGRRTAPSQVTLGGHRAAHMQEQPGSGLRLLPTESSHVPPWLWHDVPAWL